MATYTRLTDSDAIDPLIASSHERTVLIFKHSLTCPISRTAFGEYERFLAARPDEDPIDHRLIEIQNARPVSNAVAERTGVRHESPQALLLRGGDVTWHASHFSIKADALAEAVAD